MRWIDHYESREKVARLHGLIVDMALDYPGSIDELLTICRAIDDSPKTREMVSELTVRLDEHWDAENKAIAADIEAESFAIGIMTGSRLLPKPTQFNNSEAQR